MKSKTLKSSIYTIYTIYTIILSLFLFLPLYGLAEKETYSLKDYLQKVASMHPEQKLNFFDPKVADASYHEAKYGYSPLINAGYSRIDNNSVTPGSFPMVNDRYTVGVAKTFAHTGTMLSADFINSHTTMAPSPITGYLNYDQWNSAYQFSLQQPLLRGGPISMPRMKQLDILKESVRLNRSINNLKLEGIIFSSFSLYWQLKLNQTQLELTEASLKDSLDMLNKNRERVNLGTVDIDEVYDFEASYIQTKADYNNSKKTIVDLKKEFLYTLGMTETGSNELEFKLQDELKGEELELDKSRIYDNARENRKDLEQAQIQKKMSKLYLDIAKVTMLPRLDFALTTVFQGSDMNQSDLSKAIEDINFDKNHMNMTLGLQFQMPLDLRALKVVVEKAEVNYDKSLENLKKLDHSMQKELNNLIRSVEYLDETEKAYRKTVELMSKKLEIYRKKYERGKIDSTIYVYANEDLRRWQKIHLSTLFSFKIAEAQLKMAQGTFLKEYNIDEIKVESEVN